MRDAQIDAIKTYLFLKIKCESKPLYHLFTTGIFNTVDIGELSLPDRVKDYLRHNPAAAALYEYACIKDDQGAQVSNALAEQIEKDPESIDYQSFFRDAFYNILNMNRIILNI